MRNLQKEFQAIDKLRPVKLFTITKDFQNFKIKENKALKGYFSQVMKILNQARSLGEILTYTLACKKIFISLSPK